MKLTIQNAVGNGFLVSLSKASSAPSMELDVVLVAQVALVIKLCRETH